MKNKKSKLVFTMLIIIAALFAILNIVWLIFVQVKYHSYEKAIGYDEERQRYYYKDQDDYVYSVGMPNYLSFTGNLAITPVINIDENGKATDKERIDLIIWPTVFGKYEYGVSIQLLDDSNTESAVKYTTYEIMLDENKKPIENLNEKEQKIFEENQGKIDLIYQKAKAMWNIQSSN